MAGAAARDVAPSFERLVGHSVGTAATSLAAETSMVANGRK